MIWQPEISLIPWWIIMAAWHAHLIDDGRPIKHGWWAAFSGLLIAVATWWAWPDLPGLLPILFVSAQGCGRLVVFNVALNLFRGLPWTYSSPTTTSILDQLERRLFGARVWLLELILADLFVILQFFL